MSVSSKTFTVALLFIAILAVIVYMPMSVAAKAENTTDNNTTTATPTLTVTPSPTASPSASPTPTPIIGPLFSNAYWNDDHVTVTVTNNRAEQIQVTAYLGSTSNNTIYLVKPGVTQTLDTPAVNAANGQILQFGFIAAYTNGTELTSDSLQGPVTVIRGATPTPVPQETVILSGTIIDSTNQTPVAGAEVIFISTTYAKQYPPVVTGSDGTFTTPKMYPDSYQITIKADGYKTGFGTTPMVEGTKIINPIAIDHVEAPSQTPTTAPTAIPTPSPTQSIVNSWMSVLSSPQVCLGTLSALVAVIAGSIGIYEWLARQRNARLKKEKEVSDKEKADKIAADMKKASESELAERPAEDNDKWPEGDRK